MAARGYRRSGPPSGRASTTTAAHSDKPGRLFQPLESPTTPCCDDRLSSGGGVVVVRVCARESLVAGDRGRVPGGHRLPGDCGQPAGARLDLRVQRALATVESRSEAKKT